MSEVTRSVGVGLVGGGALLIGAHFIGAYLQGADVLKDAMDPFVLENYSIFLALSPGAFLIWVSQFFSDRQRLMDANKTRRRACFNPPPSDPHSVRKDDQQGAN
jgi:hypothetical protein